MSFKIILLFVSMYQLAASCLVLHYILHQPLIISKDLVAQMVPIALLNFVVLWDSIFENRRTGDLAIDISRTKKYLLFCTFSEITIIASALKHIYPTANSIARLSQLWITLYAKNKTKIIKNLQDSGNCCGLASLTDKA